LAHVEVEVEIGDGGRRDLEDLGVGSLAKVVAARDSGAG
jgi:hypothetical protein